VVGRQGLDVVAVSPEADASVGPDDKKRDHGDAQLVGSGWRKPCARILIARPGREHDSRFDDGRAAPGPYGAVKSCESFALHRTAASISNLLDVSR
jgi:hypothetical protein